MTTQSNYPYQLPTNIFPTATTEQSIKTDPAITADFPSPTMAPTIGLDSFEIDMDPFAFTPDNTWNTTLEDTFTWSDFDFTTMAPAVSNPLDLGLGLSTSSAPQAVFANHNQIHSGSSNFGSDSSPIQTASSPSSINLISPKSSISSLAEVGPSVTIPGQQHLPTSSASGSTLTEADTAEALSAHHLKRFLHYKAVAAQAEADARAATALQSNLASNEPSFEALLASYSLPTSTSIPSFGPNDLGMSLSGNKADTDLANSTMFAYQQQQVDQSNHFFSNMQQQPQYFTYNPQSQAQHQANLANAQAEAHLQAHDVAAARAHQSRNQTGQWVNTTQPPFEPVPARPQQHWSRNSISTSAGSPPFPSTPNYAAPVVQPMMVDTPSAQLTYSQSASSAAIPSAATIPQAFSVSAAASAHTVPLSSSLSSSSLSASSLPAASALTATSASPEGEDEMDADSSSVSESSELMLANLNGGGRGYIPGKTPDDPKKKHKCQYCGRGFARAFNLKSHMLTHNPTRAKPHQCPHPTCLRGFSRLHDLERHRQGIHNDGPLVEAKVKGVAPSVARAQGRLQKRAESGAGLV